MGNPTLAEEFLHYIDLRAGLLVGHGGDHNDAETPPQYDFPHRTFQEYLAGCHIVKGLPKQLVPKLREKATHEDYWRVPVRLGLEEFYFNRFSHEALSDVARRLLAPTDRTERGQLWGAYIADIVGIAQIQQDLDDQDLEIDFAKKLRRGLTAIIQNGESPLTLAERAEVGRYLNLVGDRRPGVGVKNDLPDLVWGKIIPADTYTIGKGKEVANRHILSTHTISHHIYSVSSIYRR